MTIDFKETQKEQKTEETKKLKQLGSRAIEDAIEKAICELTATKYVADIHTITFGNIPPISQETVEIHLKFTEAFKYDLTWAEEIDNA